MWVKAVLRGKFIALNAHIRKEDISIINNLSFYLRKPEKEEWIKLVSRRKEIINIRAGINEIKRSYYGKLEVSQNIENITTLWSNNSTSGYLSEGNKNTNLERHMHPSVHRSIVYSSKDMEATQVPVNSIYI